MLALASLLLIVVHAPDGRIIQINPSQIIAMRAATYSPNKLVHGKVQCLIHTVDGHFIGVIETCVVVNQMLEAR
jgi:hypothetical protein